MKKTTVGKGMPNPRTATFWLHTYVRSKFTLRGTQCTERVTDSIYETSVTTTSSRSTTTATPMVAHCGCGLHAQIWQRGEDTTAVTSQALAHGSKALLLHHGITCFVVVGGACRCPIMRRHDPLATATATTIVASAGVIGTRAIWRGALVMKGQTRPNVVPSSRLMTTGGRRQTTEALVQDQKQLRESDHRGAAVCWRLPGTTSLLLLLRHKRWRSHRIVTIPIEAPPSPHNAEGAVQRFAFGCKRTRANCWQQVHEVQHGCLVFIEVGSRLG